MAEAGLFQIPMLEVNLTSEVGCLGVVCSDMRKKTFQERKTTGKRRLTGNELAVLVGVNQAGEGHVPGCPWPGREGAMNGC